MLDQSGLPSNPKLSTRPPWADKPKNELQALIAEQERRGVDALKLYEPLPFQEEYHRSTEREVIMLKATRAGGSLAGFVEDARAALGMDPYGKYPTEYRGEGHEYHMVCLGYGEGHIGRVIHKFLFRPGAFTIIKDEQDGHLRVFRPWHRDDVVDGKRGDIGREAESMPCGPLIPKRFIKGKPVWASRRAYVFNRIDLTTGWVIWGANSAGDPNQFQGFDVHLYHIDEDVARPGWYTEATSRTQNVLGKIRWTAKPRNRTEELINLVNRARAQETEADRATKVIQATMYDNPYMPARAKAENERMWREMGEDVYRERALGELTTDSVRMYPSFNRTTHDYRKQPGEVCQKLKDGKGGVPEGWCRYLAVDPGHTVCAVLFVAVPPPSLGDHIYVYDELYLRQANAMMFGDAMEKKARDKGFQAFIIDAHGGRLTDFGSGLTPREQYSKELEKHGVWSVETGCEFLSGSDVVEGRENALRAWLSIRGDGTSKLIVDIDACPNYCREMENFYKKFQDMGGTRAVLNEGNRRFNVHEVECSEYLAAHGCAYVPPPKSVVHKSWIDIAIADLQKRRASRDRSQGGGGIQLGPTGLRT